jgi:hypothetical protein
MNKIDRDLLLAVLAIINDPDPHYALKDYSPEGEIAVEKLKTAALAKCKEYNSLK